MQNIKATLLYYNKRLIRVFLCQSLSISNSILKKPVISELSRFVLSYLKRNFLTHY